ncbi:MAG: Rieske 2Fe-2S domain-containing protein [Burkholderiaceae bacterium]|nr:Rieske 2Fe-2S domain-containing protein [Burkholderiaceae bacterium]
MVDGRTGLIDRRIFADPLVYERELAQIFGRCWLLLGHECQIPNENDYMTAYMGEDPVIVSRLAGGRIVAHLNMCRHRGNRVCRADSGNARSFTCPFHGWTFGNDGRLDHVPGLDEVYYGELDVASNGLVPVGQLDTYKGLIWATWDRDAPPLLDYLGDMAWYLDLVLDRREGGIEFLPGVHKWQVHCNWKFPADNFIGDSYHGPVSHKSAWVSGFEGQPRRKPGYGYEGFQISPGNGHGLGARWAESPEEYVAMGLPEFQEYDRARLPEAEQRLGPVRAWKISPMHATIFPNVSILWQGGTIRVWHPRGPGLTQAWGWCFVDRDAPAPMKKIVRLHETHRHGTSGTWETDDIDNWVMSTQASRGHVARAYPANISMGVGHESSFPELRGRIGKFQSEINQRAFYSHWAEMMASEGRWPALERGGESVAERAAGGR